MRTLAKYAALLLGGLLAALFIVEGGIRLYSVLWFPRMMQLDNRLGWKHAPNTRKIFVNEFGERAEVSLNEHGHRGAAYPLAKDPKKYRILVLGDSFTEGVQVGEDDVFTALLERSNPHFQVLNAGVGGYGTVQEYLYLESSGLKHNPDLVLLMVFDNDLSDNCLEAYPGFGPRPHAVRNGQAVKIVTNPDPREFLKYALPVPFANQLNEYSYLFYLLNTDVYHRLRATRMRELQSADLARAEQCGRYEVMFGVLGKFVQLLASNGVQLALVLIPTREQAQRGEAPTLQPILDFCERHGIACLSLLERFRREMHQAQPYFPADIHWTKAGHRLAADEISRFLQDLTQQTNKKQNDDGRE
jgi:lysophospholipase L1-like esterase